MTYNKESLPEHLQGATHLLLRGGWQKILGDSLVARDPGEMPSVGTHVTMTMHLRAVQNPDLEFDTVIDGERVRVSCPTDSVLATATRHRPAPRAQEPAEYQATHLVTPPNGSIDQATFRHTFRFSGGASLEAMRSQALQGYEADGELVLGEPWYHLDHPFWEMRAVLVTATDNQLNTHAWATRHGWVVLHPTNVELPELREILGKPGWRWLSGSR